MASGGQGDIEVQAALTRTVSSEMWYYSRAGKAHIASEEFSNASTGDTAALTLSNPEGSGVTGVFAPIHPSASAASYFRVYDAFDTAPSGGSSVDVQNVLLNSGNGAPDSGEITAATGDTFTASSTHVSETVGGGSGANGIGGALNMPVVALEPGREIVIEVEKLRTDGDQVSITARWFEKDELLSQKPVFPNPGDLI